LIALIDQQAVGKIVKKFERTRSVTDIARPVHHCNARFAENIVAVSESVADDPNLSILRHAQHLGLSKKLFLVWNWRYGQYVVSTRCHKPHNTTHFGAIARKIPGTCDFKIWWCQLASKIMRFDAIGLFFVGLRKKSCLCGQSSHSWTFKEQHSWSHGRSTSRNVPKSHWKLPQKDRVLQVVSWRSFKWYCIPYIMARFKQHIDNKIWSKFELQVCFI